MTIKELGMQEEVKGYSYRSVSKFQASRFRLIFGINPEPETVTLRLFRLFVTVDVCLGVSAVLGSRAR